MLSSYTTFDSKDELDKENDTNFTSALACLDGNDFETLNKKYKDEFLKFKGYLKNESLSIKQALSVFRYTLFPESILNQKRYNPREKLENLKNSILQEISFIDAELKLGYNGGDVLSLLQYVEGIWDKRCYQKEYYDKWEKDVIKYCEEHNFSPLIDSIIGNFMPLYHEYIFTQENIKQLEQAMKSQLPYNMILYRGERCSYIEQKLFFQNDFKFNRILREEKGYTSASLSYQTSFAKHQEYIIAYRLIVPKGTQGLSISKISSFPKEYEVLLNANDLFFIDVDKDFVDEFGLKKIYITALVLSKDRSCYKDLGSRKENNKNLCENEEDIYKKVK